MSRVLASTRSWVCRFQSRPRRRFVFFFSEGLVVIHQVKIEGTKQEMLHTACQCLLGKSEREIVNVATETLEGHQRSIMGTGAMTRTHRSPLKLFSSSAPPMLVVSFYFEGHGSSWGRNDDGGRDLSRPPEILSGRVRGGFAGKSLHSGILRPAGSRHNGDHRRQLHHPRHQR
jgi:hypothetical protein